MAHFAISWSTVDLVSCRGNVGAEKRGRESLLLPDSDSDTVLKHVLCKSFRLDPVAGPG